MGLNLEKVVLFAMRSHLNEQISVNLSKIASTTLQLVFLAGLLFAWVPFSSGQAGMPKQFNQLLNAVVRIDVREVSYDAGVKRFSAGVGSGVIVSKTGLILTNAHVAGPKAIELVVTLSNLERVGAKLVGWDHWTDLALLQLDLDEVNRRKLKFTYAAFGDSDKLYPGQVVYAVGTPHGLTRTVTRGIISNNRRYFQDNTGVRGYETGAFNTWLQTDAAINPGNSGGALVDVAGNLVGINTAIYSRTGGNHGIGFAIPVSSARSIMEQIIASGAVTRGWIGVEAQEITSELADSFNLPDTAGALIAGVVRGSPADRAGIRPGDVLLSINGTTVTDPQVMLDLIAGLAPESEARFRLRRDTSIQELPIRIGKRPTLQAGE